MRDWNEFSGSKFYWDEDTVDHFKFISNYWPIRFDDSNNVNVIIKK